MQNTKEIKGKYTNALIYAKNPDEAVIDQTLGICNHPVFKNCKIRIMPDCHKGKGCVIGFTSEMPKNGEIIPNIIGVDQSCGMLCIKIKNEKDSLDCKKLDKFIRNNIPAGIRGRKQISPIVPLELIDEIEKISKDFLNEDSKDDLLKIGSLGSGNHFIELAQGQNGTYLIIHCGSRNFGSKLALHFQNLAIEKKCLDDSIQKQLCYLEGKDALDYLFCAKTCAKYAHYNRKIIANEIISYMNWIEDESFETIHNYIGEDGIIRKGAISAKKDEKILIPLNMADGSLICRGKGNPDWNNSAPHGAGRALSRTQAKEKLTMDEYKKRMENIYTSSVSTGTLDESPMAYKNKNDIIELISPSVEIIECIKPLYNFKKS